MAPEIMSVYTDVAATGLHWLDIGCGNGAFTEWIVGHCEPAFVDGIDPSEAQLAFVRARLAGRAATFHQADAMALPFSDDVVDLAVMPLVRARVPLAAMVESPAMRELMP